MSLTIPKIIHQLWIGPKPSPTNFMDTWKNKHPDFEYIRWNENEIRKRGLNLLGVGSRIDEMEEINGKADIIRWIILFEYGGIFIDADSICIEPFDDTILNTKAFAGWENETLRPGLIATGTMGFPAKHPLVGLAIEWIKANCVSVEKTGLRAWQTVGPGLLTAMYNTGLFKDMTIFPSYYFLPIHCTNLEYNGHGKIYAYQEWGSTKQNYDTMNELTLPIQYIPDAPKQKVSVLVSSYNTKAIYINQCLESIKSSQGNFFIELVWINDGSTELNTILLKKILDKYEKTSRWTNVVYLENSENKGLGYTLNKGVEACSNEIIIKMDSDDIMYPDRIAKQIKYMNENPNVMICGGQIEMFKDDGKLYGMSAHSSITWDDYKKKPSHWFINHPTVCYRKSAVLTAGNYNKDLKQMAEDFELELRMLKYFGYIHNMPDTLLRYRLHENQITHAGGKGGTEYWNNIRNGIIMSMIK